MYHYDQLAQIFKYGQLVTLNSPPNFFFLDERQSVIQTKGSFVFHPEKVVKFTLLAVFWGVEKQGKLPVLDKTLSIVKRSLHEQPAITLQGILFNLPLSFFHTTQYTKRSYWAVELLQKYGILPPVL